MSKTSDTQTVIPTLTLEGAAKAIDLYKKAFNAKEEYRMDGPGGKIMHACITIGNSKMFITDASPETGCGAPSQSGFYCYVDDVDAMHAQAKKAGMTEYCPVDDMFWGDRTGSVKDPFGITWSLAKHVRDVSPEEMEKGRQEFLSKMKKAA